MTPSEIIADLDALARYAGTSDYRLGLERRARAALLRPVSHWTALMKLAMLKGIKTGVVCIEDFMLIRFSHTNAETC